MRRTSGIVGLRQAWSWLRGRLAEAPGVDCISTSSLAVLAGGGCVRVTLKTYCRNTRSQAAIERLGAVREGVLRKHMNVRGYQRDTVYFSILETEWPAVKARLEARLTAGA